MSPTNGQNEPRDEAGASADERITIAIPDFNAMSDDEVAAHHSTRLLDGRWSMLTRSLLARFGVAKLDLNDAWARTWQGWECPCCNRSKAAIARRSEGAVLLCKLDEHHDHLVDFVKALFRTTSRQSCLMMCVCGGLAPA